MDSISTQPYIVNGTEFTYDEFSKGAGVVRGKFLFLSTKATRPSHRFRVEQLLPTLEKRGHLCSVDFFPKNPISRFFFYRQLSKYDVVVIQQRTIDPIELKYVRHLSKRLVFDLDDSVMYDSQGQSDRRRQRRFAAMVRAADLVICGNEFLSRQVASNLAKFRRNTAVELLPTAINTDLFQPGLRPTKESSLVTIGWTGSRSTNRYLNEMFPILANIKGPTELKVISDTNEGLDFALLGRMPHRFVKWSAAAEVSETAEFDIGLMPLPDDNSTRGKCGCKALQYMALGIPAVCSPVGMNRELIQNGQNGYLPENPDNWTHVLNDLVDDATWRGQIGLAGRKTAELKYSVRDISLRLARLLEQTVIPHKQSA